MSEVLLASSFNTATHADLMITLTASDIDTASGSLVFSLVNVDSAKLSGQPQWQHSDADTGGRHQWHNDG